MTQYCINCGSPQEAGKPFCGRCGTRFAEAPPSFPEASAAQYPDTISAFLPSVPPPAYGQLPPDAYGPGPVTPPTGPRSNRRFAALVVAGVVLLAGIGTGSWALTRENTSSASASVKPSVSTKQSSPAVVAAPKGQPTPTQPVAAQSTPPSIPPTTPPPVVTSPSPLPPAPAPTIPGPITVASGANDSTTRAVGIYLDKYFNAINEHDYNAYYALLDPGLQQGITPSSFANGYSSSRDSDEVLTSIGSFEGYVVASVTFTSKQNVSQSHSGSGCTSWQIQLFLEPDGDSYVDANPPADAGYHAQFAAC